MNFGNYSILFSNYYECMHKRLLENSGSLNQCSLNMAMRSDTTLGGILYQMSHCCFVTKKGCMSS